MDGDIADYGLNLQKPNWEYKKTPDGAHRYAKFQNKRNDSKYNILLQVKMRVFIPRVRFIAV
jgi:hypothetical protein